MIPGELRVLPQWIAWAYQPKAGGKPTKIPLSPRTGRKASSTNPETWGTYRDSLGVLGADGIGFVFTADDPYMGLDLDNCVSASGRIHPAANKVTRRVGGYVEFSPSGRGLHVITRGTLERGRHTLSTPWGDELALYSAGRFFTMTGEGHGEIRDSQAGVDGLLAEFFPSPDVSAPTGRPAALSGDDRVVVDRLLAWPETSALWAGDSAAYGDDVSAGDLALCSKIAQLVGGDHARVNRVFRLSGRMREKWDSPRGDGTYGSQTIERALR